PRRRRRYRPRSVHCPWHRYFHGGCHYRRVHRRNRYHGANLSAGSCRRRSIGRDMALILVVDDEVEVGEAIRRVLDRAGFTVVVAHGVSEGLAAAETQQPDIVVTDMIMPRANGIELIKALR